MKITVKIDGQLYEVEIENLNDRPVIASVDGERFEIWPEMPSKNGYKAAQAEAPEVPSAQAPKPVRAPKPGSGQISTNNSLNVVHAPIPGVITAIHVHPGAEVQMGDQLCMLEAMKMNNSIRASRSGIIAAIHIAVGQQVKHHEVLMEYALDTEAVLP